MDVFFFEFDMRHGLVDLNWAFQYWLGSKNQVILATSNHFRWGFEDA